MSEQNKKVDAKSKKELTLDDLEEVAGGIDVEEVGEIGGKEGIRDIKFQE